VVVARTVAVYPQPDGSTNRLLAVILPRFCLSEPPKPFPSALAAAQGRV
jgi:hypothetical protein